MTGAAPRRRWLLPLLFVSLAVNLLIAGIVVGSAISGARHLRDDALRSRGVIGEPFVRALPDDQRRRLAADVLREGQTLRRNRSALRGRLETLLAAIRSDPYDREAVAALLAGQRREILARQDIGERLLLDRLDDMSAGERARYADRLGAIFRRRGLPGD